MRIVIELKNEKLSCNSDVSRIETIAFLEIAKNSVVSGSRDKPQPTGVLNENPNNQDDGK